MKFEISNEYLLNEKIKSITNFKQHFYLNQFSQTFSCFYHGIELTFKTQSPSFIDSLKSYIPESWHSNGFSTQKIIYLASPAELGFSDLDWSNEVSQDCITFQNNNVAIQRDFAAQINNDEIFLICEDKVGDGFYNFLRWFLSEQLLLLGKYVVHASCVMDKSGMAHLFLGHSGAGKTTITKLSHPRLVLGDDMNLVSLDQYGFFAEAGAIGGLFASMIGYDKKIPIKACYWLNQDNKNEIVEMDSLTANQKLLASFANLHWPSLSESKINLLIDFSSLVTKQTTFYQLNFLKDSSVWDLIDP